MLLRSTLLECFAANVYLLSLFQQQRESIWCHRVQPISCQHLSEISLVDSLRLRQGYTDQLLHLIPLLACQNALHFLLEFVAVFRELVYVPNAIVYLNIESIIFQK